jgi:hypothetical protein
VTDETASEDGTKPVLRVVNPDATPEEIAALVAVFSALGGEDEAPRRRRAPEWNSPYRQVRPFYSHGPGGWRSSGLPKHRGRGN